MNWKVNFHPEFLTEFEEFSEDVQDEIAGRIELLSLSAERRKKIKEKGNQLIKRVREFASIP